MACIIMRRMGKSLMGQHPARLKVHVTFFVKHLHETGIAIRIRDDHHIVEILCRSPNHAGTANVDIFDGFRFCHVRFSNRRFKRIQVADHQINRFNAVLFHIFHVFGIAAHRKDSAMNLWIQRLDAAVHHLRRARHITDIGHRNTGILDGFHGSARRNDFDAFIMKEAG